MLYEYAIDPSLLADISNCQTVFFNFKPEKGKVIADVPRKWHQEAFQAINGIPHEQCKPVLRKTLKNHLNKLLKESVCCNRQNYSWDRNTETWLQHAKELNNAYPFAAVLAAEALLEPIRHMHSHNYC